MRGLPRGLDGAGFLKNALNGPSQPPDEPDDRRLERDGFALRFEDVRPADLLRFPEVRLLDAPRVVLVYWRVFRFPLRLWGLSLLRSVIFGIIARLVCNHPQGNITGK